ncbi:Adaptive-response sensory-kinase SasA [Paenibacillus solanacearum]|uniref:histidine kinase n=1 Tax=Paenibacillus solanacearum TaxID=2048548 RepID=A0A916K5H6_9BACL|nr:ATP-binding protein [Paenibacillus solanacearum]CAG7645089.1 Adaptive-response sensory-kinase SasA [Paenibacillus solanacearum]
MVPISKLYLYYKGLTTVFAIVLLSLALSGCGDRQDSGESPNLRAAGGFMPLGGYRFEQQGILALKGEWDFYWQLLLTPQELAGSGAPSPGKIVQPGSWNGLDGNDQIGGSGYGTYRLRIELNDPTPILSIKVPYIRTAYRLWVNGEEVTSSGKVGETPHNALAKYTPKAVNFHNNGRSVDIVIQVSNYDHRLGGIWNPLLIGTADQIDWHIRKGAALDTIIVGSLFAMGLHYIVNFILRRKERGSLYFGGFCLLTGLRAAFVGEGIAYYFMPGFAWLSALRIEYLCFYLAVPAIALFVHSLYPQETSRRVIRMIQWVALLFAASLLLPPPWFTYGPPAYQAMTVLVCVYLMACLIQALLHGREGALFAVTGAGMYAVTIGVDILYYNQLLSLGEVSSFGLLFCVFMTSFVISSKSAKAFMAVETLSRQMREMNIGLEQKIRERTAELERFNSSLEHMNENLARMETSRRHLLSNISHDLGTPMTLIQGYVEALIDGVVSQPEQQQKYLKLIYARITGLNRLISDLFQLSKLEARQLEFDIQPITTGEFIRYFQERYELEVVGAGLRFESETYELQSKADGQGVVYIDLNRIDQVLTNIIYNAVKHTPQGGLIQLDIILDGNSLVVQVKDNGSGIEPEDLPHIFDRFYKKDKTRNTAGGGSGLGLAIAKEIIDYHGGRIWAQSRVGQGACLAFMLPLSRPDA